jgi:hypothetical protein
MNEFWGETLNVDYKMTPVRLYTLAYTAALDRLDKITEAIENHEDNDILKSMLNNANIELDYLHDKVVEFKEQEAFEMQNRS